VSPRRSHCLLCPLWYREPRRVRLVWVPEVMSLSTAACAVFPWRVGGVATKRRCSPMPPPTTACPHFLQRATPPLHRAGHPSGNALRTSSRPGDRPGWSPPTTSCSRSRRPRASTHARTRSSAPEPPVPPADRPRRLDRLQTLS
jgi:hypothetical protein